MVQGLDFITSNPATDAYQKAEKAVRENDLSDLKLATGTQELDEKKLTQPTRLRQLEANTSTAETGAETAKAEAPYAAPLKAAGLRSATAAATNSEMAGFYKSLEALNAGDVEGAKEIARQSGHDLPQAVIDDAVTRKDVTEAAKTYQSVYEKRPRDWVTAMNSYLAERKRMREAGQTKSDPSTVYAAPGLPEPQEASDFKSRFEMVPGTRTSPDTGQPEQGYIHHDRTSGDTSFVSGTTLTGKAGGAGGGRTSMTERMTQDLIAAAAKEGRALSLEDALGIIKRSGQSPDVLTLRKEALALSAAKEDIGFTRNPLPTLEKYRQQYGLPPAGSQPAPAPGPQSSRVVGPNETIPGVTTAPAPNPSPQRPAMMAPGNGSKPLDIQAPPIPANLPQGVQYSWSPARQQFRDELGRIYDKNGTPVS